jgi:hypothetical protein
MVLAVAIGLGLSALVRAGGRRLATAVAVVVLAVLASTTDKVLAIWAGPGPMFTYLVSAIPPGEEHDRILSRFAMFDYLYGRPEEARVKIDTCVRDFPASEEIGKVKAQIEDPNGRLAPIGERVPIAFMHSQLGLYFLKRGEPEEAGVQLHRALQFDPTLFQADYNLAILESSEGMPRSATHHLLLAEAHGGGSLSAAAIENCGRLILNAARQAGDDALARAMASRLSKKAL